MNLFDKANAGLQPFLDMSGYEPKTTFWQDFSIADAFGVSAVKDTFNRAFNEWQSNVEYLTELVMVLNWKIWYHHEHGNEALAHVYNDLWEQADRWALENLKDDDKQYFLRVTD